MIRLAENIAHVEKATNISGLYRILFGTTEEQYYSKFLRMWYEGVRNSTDPT
jgi:hypothetical protein